MHIVQLKGGIPQQSLLDCICVFEAWDVSGWSGLPWLMPMRVKMRRSRERSFILSLGSILFLVEKTNSERAGKGKLGKKREAKIAKKRSKHQKRNEQEEIV